MEFVNEENASRSVLGRAVDPGVNQLTAPTTRSVSTEKAVVVGLYGVPGSGKTFLLHQLMGELGKEPFAFYEGSQMIASLVPGGLDAFQNLEEQEKVRLRQRAIDTIKKECVDSGKTAVVAGHFMFWPEEEDTGRPVYTQNDLDTFTHILYLDVPSEVVVQRCQDDTERSRLPTSISHLRKWQHAEKTQLRCLCRENGILFSLVFPYLMSPEKASALLRDFRNHTENHNLLYAERRLDEAFAGRSQLETVLVMDADRTLAPQDTGKLFWEKLANFRGLRYKESPLKTLFSSPLSYSYTAFRQAALLYESTVDEQDFDTLCQDVASAVTMHPDFVSLLHLVAEQDHIGILIITCGLRHIWDKVLEKEGLSKTVKVIGGGRITDGFVVTPEIKGALVTRLRDVHQTYVWTFGDSPLDLVMLSRAHQAIVVVGEEQTRSKTMDAALLNAIDNDGLQARQVVLPGNAPPRLDNTKLPVVQLTEHDFVDAIVSHRRPHASLHLVHATQKSAVKLLMTPMRDSTISGPALREAHCRVGWYLATEFLTDVIGVEEHPILHVQGHRTSGYRLSHEHQTLIVALMRGGEAMAFGVNEVFPLAMFIHARCPEDITVNQLQGKLTVVLVDSVVNSGKTMMQFVQHIRNLDATIRIVIVAGVIQAQSVSGGRFTQALAGHAKLSVITLRLSDNKFTGRGTTDTGNRLFNTTHLP